MVQEEKFDIFIAYYGNKQTGSENAAREIFEYINGKEIYPGKRIKAYFHPVTDPYGRFENTPEVVARTPMFLLVTDKNITRTVNGQLPRNREDGSLSNIYEEVRSFHDSPMYKSRGGDTAAKVFITDDFDFKAAEYLHPVFSGKTAFTLKSEVLEWIIYFFSKTYVSRIYESCKYNVANNEDEFMNGLWVREAEEIWNCLHDESLGRTLLIYYIKWYDKGDTGAIQKLRPIYEKMSSMQWRDHITGQLLDRIRLKLMQA